MSDAGSSADGKTQISNGKRSGGAALLFQGRLALLLLQLREAGGVVRLASPGFPPQVALAVFAK